MWKNIKVRFEINVNTEPMNFASIMLPRTIHHRQGREISPCKPEQRSSCPIYPIPMEKDWPQALHSTGLVVTEDEEWNEQEAQHHRNKQPSRTWLKYKMTFLFRIILPFSNIKSLLQFIYLNLLTNERLCEGHRLPKTANRFIVRKQVTGMKYSFGMTKSE